MYKICSLFAGVGGIDLGFLETDKCEIAYANEFDKYAVETYEKNFNTKVDCRDIHDVKLNEIYLVNNGNSKRYKREGYEYPLRKHNPKM